MLEINKYRFGNFNIIGYYNEKTNEAYGYLDTYPSLFKVLVLSGKPVKAREGVETGLKEYISKQLEEYVNYKNKEYALKNGSYVETIEQLELKAAMFFNLISDLKSADKGAKDVLKEYTVLNFDEVELMLTGMVETDKGLGKEPKIEKELPYKVFFEYYPTFDNMLAYFKNNFKDIRFNRTYPLDGSICKVDLKCKVTDYVNFIKETAGYDLEDFEVNYNGENSMLELTFTLDPKDLLEDFYADIKAVGILAADISKFKKSLKTK